MGERKTSTAQKRFKIMDLVDVAVTVLAREMVQADKSADRQRAANSILDRAGLSRTISSPDSEASAELLKEKLAQLKAQREQVVPEGSEPEEHGVSIGEQLIDRARAFYLDDDEVVPEEEVMVRTRAITEEQVLAKVRAVRPQSVAEEPDLAKAVEAGEQEITPPVLLGQSLNEKFKTKTPPEQLEEEL